MQKNRPFVRKGWGAVCIASVCAMPVMAAQDELDTVREMLRIDAERALAQERQRGGGPPPKAKVVVAPKPAERVSVQAIYGLTGKLKAEVVVNGERKEFRQGSEWARGAISSPQEYRLVRIDDTCVHLSKATGGLRVACFDPAQLAAPARGLVAPSAPQSIGLGMPFAPSMLTPATAPASLVQRQP